MRKRDVLFFVFLGALSTTALAWLLLGVLPAIASLSTGFHEALHDLGERGGPFGEIARNAANASHSARSAFQVSLDYLFSLLNLGLAGLIVYLAGRDRTARLLAVGMIGSAVAFNLQGHDALQVLPVAALAEVSVWHDSIHIATGLAYLYALLLFPTGRLKTRTRLRQALLAPAVVFVTLFFTLLSLTTADDHTFGLVIVYGIAVPVAGLASQTIRFRAAPDEDQRQQSRVLLLALALALLVAVPLIVATNAAGDPADSRTVDYEFTPPTAGSFYFRCDPHPDDMEGTVRVVADDSTSTEVKVAAEDNEFDTKTLVLAAGKRNFIRFTSFDADLHNVAIYRDATATEPLFVGAEFSGQTSALPAFRVFRILFAVIPLGLLAGLVRTHLWNIDKVVNRALLYTVLALFITVAYLVVVIGMGALLGAGTGFSLFLSIALTALLAALFQPLRARAHRLANRLVYGNRATPYEVIAELAERLGGAYAPDEVIPQMAEIVATGTRARRVDIWLRVGDHLVLSATWPEDAPRPSHSFAVTGTALPEIQGADRAVAVMHGGELLGALSITKPPGEPLSIVEDRLLADVAAQAGLVLRNANLTAELQARLEDLRASRQRIVAAQDAERRRLERDIHDGAQQHLVALSAKLRLAQENAEKDPAAAARLLAELQTDTNEALRTLRDLARGVYPPVLADKGLIAALEAHARRCPEEVRVSGPGFPRLPSAIENAVYFCCLEAVQNALKHGRPPIDVTLAAGRDVVFAVTDRGAGFDPAAVNEGSGLQNMSDRIAALGGGLTFESGSAGTIVRGRIPLRQSQGITERP